MPPTGCWWHGWSTNDEGKQYLLGSLQLLELCNDRCGQPQWGKACGQCLRTNAHSCSGQHGMHLRGCPVGRRSRSHQPCSLRHGSNRFDAGHFGLVPCPLYDLLRNGIHLWSELRCFRYRRLLLMSLQLWFWPYLDRIERRTGRVLEAARWAQERMCPAQRSLSQ